MALIQILKRQKMKLTTLIVMALLVAGCAPRIEVKTVKSDDFKVLELLRPVKFYGQVFGKGEQLELIEVDSGEKVVLMTRQKNSSFTGVVSEGVVLGIPVVTKFTYGAVLDEELCSTDNFYLRYDDLFMTTEEIVFTAEDPDLRNWKPARFCFKELAK